MSIRYLPVVLVAAVAIVGCTRPETAEAPDADATLPTVDDSSTDPSTTAPASDISTSSVPSSSVAPETSGPTTTPGPTTTLPPAPTTTAPSMTGTTVAPTTTAASPTAPADFVLIFDGIVPTRFGDRDVDVIATLAPVLGEPTVDAVSEYPIADDGSFLNADDESFVAPFGRRVCWSNGLCTQFGAGTRDTLIFTGWRLDRASSGLATRDGITVGDRWADHLDDITVDPFASCFSVAYAAADGIDVELVSADGPFAAPNEDGEFVAGDPDPAAVTVQSLSAGALPFFVFADC